MKVLLYVGRLGGGGAEHVAAMWANGFLLRGHEVCVVVNSRCKNEYQVSKSINIIVAHQNSKFKILRQIRQIINVRNAIKLFTPDVIITVLHPCGLYAYLATLGLRIPIINTEHNAFERPGEAKWSRFELFNKFYVNKLFKGVTVLTQTDKDLIGDRLKNVTVLPNPLAFESVSALPVKEKNVLAMGRLDAWYIKGFDVLIKAWKNVSASHPDWKLQIAGAGNEKAKRELTQFYEESNVTGTVELIGFFENPVMVYRPASIFVLSSRCEGFGMVIVEAMSQGCACVACDYGGRQGEIIRSESEGLVCETENVEQLSSCICRLIEDEQLRTNIQHNSIKRSKDYQLNVIMDKWDGIIAKINN